ncbi:MAG: hypothetical protein ABIF11_10435 [Nitrospirota bacterium]
MRNLKGQFVKGHKQIGGFFKGHKIRNTGKTYFKKGMIPLNKKEVGKKCKNCRKDFLTTECKNHKFCSQKCYWEYLKGRNNFDYPENRKKREKNLEAGRKISKALRERFKDITKHPCWKGGISKEPYSPDWTVTLRESIRQRDKYACRLCGRTQEEELERYERKLPIHHIDYNKKDCNPTNLITFCVSCNAKVNFNREYWMNYFKKSIIKVSQ